MSKALQIAENLATFTANHERVGDIFAPAVSELCRLAVIERAATALIKCKGRYHAEQNTKALAEALDIALPLPASGLPVMVNTAPEEIWLQVSDTKDDAELPFPDNHADVTWCSESALKSEVQYVRADLPVSDRPAESRAEDLLVRALVALEYHTQQTWPIEQTENVITSLRAHCTPQHAKQEQPRPSAIELQAAEIGIPEPVTELINPASLNRTEALAQLVGGVKVWPETRYSYIAPNGWEWVHPEGCEVSLCKIGEVGVFKQDWQRALLIPPARQGGSDA